MDDESLEKRLSAVERALTNDETPTQRRDVERRVEDAEERIRELEAATQALRGYVGDVRDRGTQIGGHSDSGLERVQRMEVGPEHLATSRRKSPGRESIQNCGSAEPDEGVLDKLAAWL
jgi:hypothetical protein